MTFWLDDVGVITLPSIDGKMPFIESWRQFQTRYPNAEELSIIEQRLKAATSVQIILGQLYFNSKPTGYHLTCYDLDNEPAVKEFCSLFNVNTLEQLAEIEGFLVEVSKDGKRAHVYVITQKPLRSRKLQHYKEGRKSTTVPALEVKSTSQYLMTVALDDDPDKRYHFVGNYKNFVNHKNWHNAMTLEACIDKIEQKYWNEYHPKIGTASKGLDDPTRILIDTVDGIAYEGIRDEAIYKLACHKFRTLWDTTTQEEIERQIHDENQKRCSPPLKESQVNEKIKSALKWVGDQIELEKINGNGNNNNNKKAEADNEKYEELRGNVYYRTNKRPTKYIVADALTHQVIEVQLKAKVKSVSELQIESNTVECYLRHNRAFLACIPIKIIRHKNPLTFLQLQETFTIVFVDEMGEHYTFSHKTLSAIIQSLKEKALVINDGADSALSSIIQGFKQRNLIEINEELGYTGFFRINDKILASNLEINNPSIEKLRDALSLVDELKTYYENRVDLLATSIVWGMIAPAIFMLKTNNYFLKGLNFYGFSNATKTNTGRIILAIDGNHEDYNNHAINFNMVDTTAKLGSAVSRSTFPILIDEVDLNDIRNSHLVNMIKIIIESVKARDKFANSKDSDPSSIPALSCLILTSNLPPPFHNSGLMRRLLSRPFSLNESVKQDDPKAIQFKEFLRDNLPQLKALGDFRNWYIMNHQEEFLNDKRPEPLDLGLKILREAFAFCGREIPDWLVKERLPENQLEDSMQDNDVIVKRTFEKYIDEQLKNAVYVWRAGLSTDEAKLGIVIPVLTSEKIGRLVESNNLQDIKYSAKIDRFLIGAGILKELYDRGATKDQIPNLKALADYMGGEFGIKDGYKVVKVSIKKLKIYFNEIDPSSDSSDSSDTSILDTNQKNIDEYENPEGD